MNMLFEELLGNHITAKTPSAGAEKGKEVPFIVPMEIHPRFIQGTNQRQTIPLLKHGKLCSASNHPSFLSGKRYFPLTYSTAK